MTRKIWLTSFPRPPNHPRVNDSHISTSDHFKNWCLQSDQLLKVRTQSPQVDRNYSQNILQSSAFLDHLRDLRALVFVVSSSTNWLVVDIEDTIKIRTTWSPACLDHTAWHSIQYLLPDWILTNFKTRIPLQMLNFQNNNDHITLAADINFLS